MFILLAVEVCHCDTCVKHGKCSDVNNSSPVSVLLLILKILQRLIKYQFHDCLECQGLLLHRLHGFRKLHSCQSAILTLTNALFAHRDNKQHTIVASLDVLKAVKTLNHLTLVHRLAALDVAENII